MSCHTGTHRKGKVGMLKSGQLALESQTSWVATTSVVKYYRLTRGRLGVGRREVERHGDTAELLAGLRAAMDDARRETTNSNK